MKKIILAVSLFFILFGQTYAYDVTNNFHLTNKIENVYITRYNSINSRNGAIYIIKDSNNNIVYCIEPFQPNLNNNLYEGYYENYSKFNLSKEQVDRINLISYYGYGYTNQTENKWYIITQALIWRELGLNTYFTKVYHGEKVEMFNDEMNKITTNVNKHYIKPNFDENYDISINKELVLEDSNNVLDNYEIDTNDNIKISKIDNKLIISAEKEGNYKIKLVKKDKIKSNKKTLFYNSDSQNVFLAGKFEDIEKEIDLNVYEGKITLNKVSDYSCKKTTLKGAIYEIYDSSNILIKEIVSDEEGNAIIDNLPIDTYYIKEKISSKGHKKDDKIYKVELTYENNNQNIEIKNELLDNICTVNKEENSNLYTIDIPNTLSNSINFISIISGLFIFIGLGVIIKYAKKN